MIEKIGSFLLQSGIEMVAEKIFNRSGDDESTDETDFVDSDDYADDDEFNEEEYREIIKQGLEAFDAEDYQTSFEILSNCEYYTSTTLYCLAFMTFNGLGCEMDKEKAITYYHRSAREGDVDALYQLGLIFTSDDDIKRDLHRAYKYFLMAAKKDHAASQYFTGLCFESGSGVEQSDKNAKKWYRKAMEQGNIDAQVRLAQIYINSKEYQTALELINDAVAKGDAEAQNLLGCCYLDGLGVEADRSKAIELFQKAADNGYEPASEAIDRCKKLINADSNSSIGGFNTNEEEYRTELQEILADGEISASERRLLKKIQLQLDITDERAAEIEESLSGKLTPEEQEYLEEFKECCEDGEISTSERRLLNKIRVKLGISEDRATEIENFK